MKRFLLLSTFMLAIVSLYAQDGVKKDVTLQLTAENIGSESSLSTALSEAISGETGEVNLILTFDNDVPALSDDDAGWLKELLERETMVTGIDMSAIGAYAILQGNTNVKDVKLPDLSDKNIPENMFWDCANLETLTIGTWKNTAGNEACAVRKIENSAFRECAKLANLNFEIKGYNNEKGETTDGGLGNDVFRGCKSLTTIPVKPAENNKGMKFGSFVFGFCDNLTEVTIPEGVIEVGESAFQECVSLTKMTLSASVEAIRYTCVTKCDKFTEFAVAEKNQTFSVNDGVLYSVNPNTLVLWPLAKETATFSSDDVTEISADAFNGCLYVGELSFPNLKTLGNHAFQYSSIKKLTLPSNMTTANNEFVYSCPKLEKIEILNNDNDGDFVSVDGIL